MQIYNSTVHQYRKSEAKLLDATFNGSLTPNFTISDKLAKNRNFKIAYNNIDKYLPMSKVFPASRWTLKSTATFSCSVSHTWSESFG